MKGYSSDLYILAFDHRGTLTKGLLGVEGRAPRGTTTVQLVSSLAGVFEESAQTNVYSDYLLLLSLMVLVIMLFVFTRKTTKEKI